MAVESAVEVKVAVEVEVNNLVKVAVDVSVVGGAEIVVVSIKGKQSVIVLRGQTKSEGNLSNTEGVLVGMCTGTTMVQEDEAESLQGARMVRAVGIGKMKL